jgi:hypothetical protein
MRILVVEDEPKMAAAVVAASAGRPAPVAPSACRFPRISDEIAHLSVTLTARWRGP